MRSLVAENIALQLENRISFRRAMKSTMQRTMKGCAKGIKTSVSGRLGGVDTGSYRVLQRGNYSAADPACRYRLWIR